VAKLPLQQESVVIVLPAPVVLAVSRSIVLLPMLACASLQDARLCEGEPFASVESTLRKVVMFVEVRGEVGSAVPAAVRRQELVKRRWTESTTNWRCQSVVLSHLQETRAVFLGVIPKVQMRRFGITPSTLT
jgi:hypothetical protein